MPESNLEVLRIQTDVSTINIERAARVCYNTLDKVGTDFAFIAKRLKQGHYGILEHLSISFLVEGVSRSLTHQLVRHRHFSYCQESQRYVSYRELPYVIPPSVKENQKALA